MNPASSMGSEEHETRKACFLYRFAGYARGDAGRRSVGTRSHDLSGRVFAVSSFEYIVSPDTGVDLSHYLTINAADSRFSVTSWSVETSSTDTVCASALQLAR